MIDLQIVVNMVLSKTRRLGVEQC